MRCDGNPISTDADSRHTNNTKARIMPKWLPVKPTSRLPQSGDQRALLSLVTKARSEKAKTMTKNQSSLGLFPDRITASDAIWVLHKASFRPEDIALMTAENLGTKDFAHEKTTRALDGAATGSVIGALAGALLGWAVSGGRLFFPGLEFLAAVTPVMASLASAACGGVFGWLAGFCMGLTLPQYVAKRYAGRKSRGGILVSVHGDSSWWCRRARVLLRETGAHSISSTRESAGDYATSDRPSLRAPAASLANPSGDAVEGGRA